MEIGMLWFDDSSRSLDDKITRAVTFYKEKYGSSPTHCLVHPETLNGGDGTLSGVKVQGARSVMQNHFWIGIDEKARRARSSRSKVVKVE
jgi:hypothetical protein